MIMTTFPSNSEYREALALYEKCLRLRAECLASGSGATVRKEFVETLEELFEQDLLIFKPFAVHQAIAAAPFSLKAIANADTEAIMQNIISVGESRKCFSIGEAIQEVNNPAYEDFMEAKERSLGDE